jgi:hypothetical protein
MRLFRRRRRSGGRLRGRLALSLLMLVCPPPSAGAVIVHEQSFTNGPEIQSPALRRGREDLWLGFDARFANDCLADVGVEGSWLDRADARARLVWLVPRTAPEGCPELFRPVTRRLWVRLPLAPSLARVILLDAGYRPDGLGTLQAAELPVSAAVQGGEEPAPQEVVRAADLQTSAYVPTLSGWKIETEGPARGSLRSFRISFEALIPGGCADRDLAVTIRESRTGVSDAEQVPVLDWLLATLPEARDCRGEPVERRRISLRREVAASYGRRVVLMNPLSPQAPQEGDVFTILDVFR